MLIRFTSTLSVLILATGVITNSPEVSAADFSAPLIELRKTKSSNPYKISTKVEDENGVFSVKIFYRVIGSKGKFRAITMKREKAGSKIFYAALPATTLKKSGFDYYIEAKDYANNISQEPFPNKPRRVYFRKKTISKKKRFRSKKTKRVTQWGGGLSYGSFSVDDPDGKTEPVYTPILSAVFTYTKIKNWRFRAELNYQQFRLPYSQERIGQDVNSIHIDLQLQRRSLPFIRGHGWISAGFSIGQNKMADRATTDANDFIQDSFEDRSETNFSAIAGFEYELAIASNRIIGIQSKIHKSINNDLEGLSVGMYFSLRYR